MKQLSIVALFATFAVVACQPAEAPAAEAPAGAETAAAEPSREELIAHGKYIVDSVGMCSDCHTPFTPEGQPDATKYLHGAALGFAPTSPMTPFKGLAPALAGLPQGCTQETLALFLQNGSACDNTPPLPPMPPYRLNAHDAKSVAAYLASLPKPT